MRAPIFIILSVSFVISSWARAAEVRSWRGDGNGLYPETPSALDWQKDVAWVTPLAERGNASPILVDGKLFLTAEPATLICIDAADGKVLWERRNEYQDLATMNDEERAKMEEARAQAAEVETEAAPLKRQLYRAERRLKRKPDDKSLSDKVSDLKRQIAELEKSLGPAAKQAKKPRTNSTNGYASYTPVSDGRHVWACFGIGVVVCYDLEGKRLWHRRTEAPDHGWGGSNSPTLVDGKLIIRFRDHVALDPATGDELWRTPPTGVSFNTAAHFEVEGQFFLLSPRGQLIRVNDGKRLPSTAYTNSSRPWAFFNTPSVVDGRIYVAHGSEGHQGDAYALEIPETVKELEQNGLKQLWHTPVVKNRYYSSPLVAAGAVHLITRDYVLLALDADSGELLYEQKVKGLKGTAYPSLTLAGEAVVIGSEEGDVVIVKPGKVYEELGRTRAEPFRSSPIFAGGIGYLRTQESLRALRGR